MVVLALAVASIVSVADNGLGFTATAELAGRAWSGRALGGQNTMQNVAAFETASFVGLLAGSFGFPWAFAVVAVFPLLGAWLRPVEGSVGLAQRVINLRLDESGGWSRMKSMGRHPACQAAPFLAAQWIWPVYNGYYMGSWAFWSANSSSIWRFSFGSSRTEGEWPSTHCLGASGFCVGLLAVIRGSAA